MSHATDESRQSGPNRRRRSRGGKNRQNNNPNTPQDSQNNRRRESSDVRELRNHASRPARVYSQPKLSFWQKILQAVGLYKAPAAPQGKPARNPENKPPAPKSNTRNARSADGGERPQRDGPSRSDGQSRGERPKSRERSARGGNPATVESGRVYVGNLSYDVTEQDLQELFKGIGAVRNVEIVYNRATHRSKGYGFVEMVHREEAMRAVEVLHDQPYMGRNMNVSGAKSKGLDERDDATNDEPRKERTVQLAPTQPAAEVSEKPQDEAPPKSEVA